MTLTKVNSCSTLLKMTFLVPVPDVCWCVLYAISSVATFAVLTVLMIYIFGKEKGIESFDVNTRLYCTVLFIVYVHRLRSEDLHGDWNLVETRRSWKDRLQSLLRHCTYKTTHNISRHCLRYFNCGTRSCTLHFLLVQVSLITTRIQITN